MISLRPFHHRLRLTRRTGFALVITLSLMVLLTVLAVGLLTLSAITLRATSQGDAMALARANARLAVIMAAGDLQKLLGPDQAVTAQSDLTLAASEGRKHLTGAWKSWAISPDNAAPDYSGEKEKRFRQWLVSDVNHEARRTQSYPSAQPTDPITLASAETEGESAVVAGRVSVNGKGGFAWHVADETVKARIGMVRDPAADPTLAGQRALVAGHRPGLRTVSSGNSFRFSDLPDDETPEQYRKALPVTTKLLDLNQAELVGGQMPRDFRNHLTTHSMGVLCDARDGGLKKDLSTAFALPGGLPEKLKDQRLYQSTHGFGGVSDPYWSVLADFYNIPAQLTAGTPPSYKVERVDPMRVDRAVVPRAYTLAPVIQKFEAMFTIVVRDNHTTVASQNPSLGSDPQRKYLLHLVYVPLVTLHNPYNVEIEFERLNLVVRDQPLAFNVFVNDKAQNKDLVPFNEMWVGTGPDGSGRGEKAVRLDLANWQYHNETSPNTAVRMKPGQTLLFGPYLDPNADSRVTLRGNSTSKDYVDADDKALKLRPGFVGKAVGYTWDWLAPNGFRASDAIHRNWGTIPLRWDDRVRLQMAIRQPEVGITDQWDLSAKIFVKNRAVEYGGMRFVYQDKATLLKHFSQTYPFPERGSIAASEMYEPYTKALKDQARGKAIMTLACAARTSNGGVYENNSRERAPAGLNTLRDGRLAGKPFIHHNPARNAILVDLKRDLPGRHSHEMNFQPLKGELDDVIEIDAMNRGSALTGNTTIKGIKSGALFDVPTGPLQTLAGFRRSNALSSTYLPNPVQPIANSWVPTMMSTDQTRESGVVSYPLLDHSYLANTALYDSYYFSTYAPRGNGSARETFRGFVESGKPLPNQCFQPWLPDGKSATRGMADLFSANAPTATAWQQAAAWQMVAGSFNVNSTSVLAWQAMLASLANTPIPVLWAKSLNLESISDPYDIPVPSFTLPLAGKAGVAAINPAKIDNIRSNDWNGFRALTPTELETLATRIVEQVKSRGPFLSMAEFVNRRIGYNTELTRVGALQAAIDKSEVNDRLFRELVPVRFNDVSDPLLYGYKTPDVSVGNPADGAPGTICQGDLLHLLEPRATVRGDTFVIRAAGQAFDGNGKVIATAYAEAVIQRVPDFIDPTNAAFTPADSLTRINRKFGRRMEMVSFRWLSPTEI